MIPVCIRWKAKKKNNFEYEYYKYRMGTKKKQTLIRTYKNVKDSWFIKL